MQEATGDFAAMDDLGRKLADPKFRRAFSESPYEALRAEGIDSSAIDEKFLAAISELSPAELRLVVDIVQRIRDTSPVDFPF